MAKRRRLGVDCEKHPQVAEEYEALWKEAKTRLKRNRVRCGASGIGDVPVYRRSVERTA